MEALKAFTSIASYLEKVDGGGGEGFLLLVTPCASGGAGLPRIAATLSNKARALAASS